MRDKAIRNTHPTVVAINAEIEAWDENGDVVVLDESLISTEVTRLQAEYDSQEYARSRKTEYPQIGDQLDSLFHAGVFPDDMTAILQAVKDKYPKE
tara:strand:+ start:236 stop:523 length:288 start_codon:yes stop_codon:yes gene_type:complete